VRRALAALLAAVACAAFSAPAGAASLPVPQSLETLMQRKLASESASSGAGAPVFEATVAPAAPPGYEVEVFGVGRAIAIAIGQDSKAGFRTAYYAVRGTVGRGRLEARFGNLGSISMRFHPNAPGLGRCSGGSKFRISHGFYAGRLRFRGEGGYISLDVHRAPGQIIDLDGTCSGHGGHAAARASSAETFVEPESTYLDAGWKDGVSSVDLLAFDERKGASFLVKTETSRGGMAISRSALIGSRRGQVKADRALTSCRVQGPAPLHGAATYAAAPDGTKTWKGKLTVNMLGEPGVGLTGPRFDEVELGRASALTLLFIFLENLF
jgi:hypothetical protein